jgi:hypothetical protein
MASSDEPLFTGMLSLARTVAAMVQYRRVREGAGL